MGDQELEKIKQTLGLDGTTDRVSGPSIGTAFALTGYGGGAIDTLDYYEEVDGKSTVVLE